MQSNTGHKTILLKKREVAPCMKAYYNKCKGSGARKMYKSICKTFTGISERDIQKYINTSQKGHRMNPIFENKPPLIPVQSSGVFNHLQIDLVTMEGSPVTVGNRVYKYIMILLDIFSRFLFLRALQSKQASEVASNLLQIFSDAGPPQRIQSDQGSEFKGAVKKLMNDLNVQISVSRPYHPQSQGKVNPSELPLLKTLIDVNELLISVHDST